jgi:hypothetical protein
MRKTLLTLFLLGLGGTAFAAQQQVYKWNAANDFYFVLPMPQTVLLKGVGRNEVLHPVGMGVRSVGNGERFSPAGGLQFLTAQTSYDENIWLLDIQGGLQYISPQARGPFRAMASALGGLGMSDNTLYFAPYLDFGVLYVTDAEALTPTGFSLNFFWRPTKILLQKAGAGGDAVLRPTIGLRLGYIFEGFWTVKEK